MRTTVAIVGGGLAGLCAARLLLQAGIEFQLLEARHRFGGRILSVNSKGEPSPDGFDLGPSWFWPAMHPSMACIVDGLGLRYFALNTEGDMLAERSGFEAVQRFQTLPQEPRSMRLVGGTGAIASALVDSLPGVRLHLGTRVTRVALGQEGPVLSLDDCGTERELATQQVILALPPRLLASTVSFEPALDIETLLRWSQTATWMAPHAKFFVLYERAFWRESGLSGTSQSSIGPQVEIHDATLASGAAALFGFVGLDHRQRLALGGEALGSAATAQLVRLFGPKAGQPQAILFKDWTADAFTATEADAQAEGHPLPDPRPWIAGN